MGSVQRSHVYVPYPELVERSFGGTPYEIRDSRAEALPTRGMVDLARRVLWVPLEAAARAISRHELGHVAWSPPRPARVRFDRRIAMCIEDARVNLGLEYVGLPVVLDGVGSRHVAMLLAQDFEQRDGFAVFMRAIASIGSSVEAELEEQLLAAPGPLGVLALAWMVRARAALESARAAVVAGPVAPYSRGVELAGELARELRALGFLDSRLEAPSLAPFGCCAVHRHDGDGLPEEVFARALGEDPGRQRAAVEPGRLEVKKAPLSVPLRPGRGGRSWRASPEGSVVRYLQRWPIDGAVFRRRAHRSGGTLLVDTSGSMALEVADLDRLLLATPHGMRVAIYSGSDDAGELRIVAEGGRRAPPAHLERFGCGNVVDLPALEWLARHAQPRIWVSDGAVTGVGDRGSGALKLRCETLCRRSRIRRVAKIDEARQLLGRA